MLIQILTHTPRWVFALLAGLVVFGVMQTRTRRVPVGMALLLPVAMLGLSLSGVLQYTSGNVVAIGCWVAGVVAVCVVGVRMLGRADVAHRVPGGRLQIAGSWMPLVVILCIFMTRFVLGVASAMQVSALAQPGVQMGVAALLGMPSGYFAARGLVFLRASRQRLAMAEAVGPV